MRTTPEQVAQQHDEARFKHYATKLRAETPDLPSDTSDEELVKADYQLAREQVPDMTAEEYWKALGDQYGKDFTPPKVVDQRTLGEKVQDFGTAVAPTAEMMGANIVAAVPGAKMVTQVGAKAAPAAAAITTGLMGLYYGSKIVPRTLSGWQELATMEGIPHESYTQLYERFAKKMVNSKLPDEQKDRVIQRAIHNIVAGRSATTESISGDVQQTGAEGRQITNEMVGNTLVNLLPFGATGTAVNAAERIAGGMAGRVGLKGAAETIASKVLSRAVGGGAFAGTFGGISAIAESLGQSYEQREGADTALGKASKGLLASSMETASKAASSFGKGFMESAPFGVLLGGGLGAIEGAAGVSVGYRKARETKARDAALAARLVGVGKFAEDFKGSDLDTKFDRIVAQADAEGLPAVTLATKIVSDLYPDVATTPEGMKAIVVITNKIASREALSGRMVTGGPEFGPTPLENIAQPVGAPLEAMGGAAPEPNTPAAIQGPIGDRFQTPTAPEGVPQVPGLEGAQLSEQRQVPFQLEGVAPAEGPAPAVRLNQPLPIERLGPGAPPEEIAPRLVGPEPPPEGGTPAPLAPLPLKSPATPGMDVERGQMLPETPQPLPNGIPLSPDVTAPENVGPVLGEAPEPNAPPAVQGPIGSQAPPFTPPAEVERVTGLESNRPPETPGRAAVSAIWAMGNPHGDLIKIGNVKLDLRPSANPKVMTLASIESLTPGSGEGAAAMKTVTEVADRYGTSIDVYAEPFKTRKGGKIPLDKLIEWYKLHGFEVVENYGNDAALLRRQPRVANPVSPEVASALAESGPAVAGRVKGVAAEKAKAAAGNVEEGKTLVPSKTPLADRIAAQLDLWGSAADQRISKRGGLKGMVPGAMDPRDLRDISISTAATMYRLGLRSTRSIGKLLIEKHGEWIKPHIDKVVEKARTLLEKSLVSEKTTKAQLKEILQTFEDGKVGKDWYDNTWKWLQETFGEDAEMMARFLSATSYGSSAEGNATQALKAYAQWKLGLPFDGYIYPGQSMGLEKATRGEVFGDLKAQGFLAALLGDENALALDRFLMRAFGYNDTGKGSGPGEVSKGRSNLTPSTYQLFSTIIRNECEALGVTPRQFQSAVWVGKKIQTVQEQWKGGAGKAEVTKTGSFRPFEDLLAAQLEGRTPAQWVKENSVRLTQLKNATEGAKKARVEGGYSFDPYTYGPYQKPGYIVTLDQRVIPEGEATGCKLINFRQKYASLIDRYHDVMIGHYRMESDPSKISQDFNIVLPNNPNNLEPAIKLGFEMRQETIGHIDVDGNYTGHKTGYDPAVHGPQFESRRVDEIDRQLETIGAPTKDVPSQMALFAPAIKEADGSVRLETPTLERMINEPAMWLSHAMDATGMTKEQIQAAVVSGNLTPMTDAGVAGAVFVTKDGTVWRYVDPKAPSFNTTELVGTLRGKNLVEMLDKLEGLEVIKGHDVIQSFRSQAGFARIAMPEPIPEAAAAKLLTSMTKIGGQVVPVSALREASRRGTHDSYWLLPNGRIVSLGDISHGRFAQLLKLPSAPGFSSGVAGGRIQTLLNRGVIRLQASGTTVAFDVSAKLTVQQKAVIKMAAAGHQTWAAQITDAKGEPISFFHSAQGDKLHHFLAKAGGEE